MVSLQDRSAAEDAVQEAFLSLNGHCPPNDPGNTPDPPRATQATRRTHLTDSGRAVAYLWSSVLNGCRSALRYRAHRPGVEIGEPIAPSAASTPWSTRNTRPYRPGCVDLPHGARR